MGKVRQMTVPVLLLINKIDLTDQEKLIKPVSYTHLTGLDTLVVHTVNDEYSLFAIYSKRPSESIKYSTWGGRRQR